MLVFSWAQQPYQTYINNRFVFSVDYPADLFMLDIAPQNGDGQHFYNEHASLNVWAKLLIEDLESSLQSALFGLKEVTYQEQKEDYFVVSGFNETGNIAYQKTQYWNGVLYTFALEYDPDYAYRYNKVTERVAASFTLPKASFDCSKAAISVEHAICNTQLFSLHDAQIAHAYGYLQESLEQDLAAELKNQQLEWLTLRNACGTSMNCLQDALESQAQYLTFLKNMAVAFASVSAYFGDSEKPVCDLALQQSADAFIETNNAYSTQGFSAFMNFWADCYAQQNFLSYALKTKPNAVNDLLKIRRTLLDLVGAYKTLRQAEAGGGTMYVMFYASAHQWLETDLAHSMQSYQENPNAIPERVLKRAGLALNASPEDKKAMLERSVKELKAQLDYARDYRLECCAGDFFEGYESRAQEAIHELQENLTLLNDQVDDLPPYLAYEVLSLANDMESWFDVR